MRNQNILTETLTTIQKSEMEKSATFNPITINNDNNLNKNESF